MQPTLALSAPHPGILYINGRFAGEISGDEPLFRPVSSRGALYLDYRPLSTACRSAARRLVFSGGEPMPESVDAAGDVQAVIWPGGTVEIEIAPPETTDSRVFSLAGRIFRLETGGMRLFCEGRPLSSLPRGANPPVHRALSGGAALLGECPGGSYLVTVDEAFTRQTGFLFARQIEIEADERIRAIFAPGDTVGHSTLEIWRLSPEGLQLVSSEAAWLHGAPRWPQTPRDTAIAAAEAALAGLDGEMENYLSPALRSRIHARDIREICDLCVPMKYALPDPRPCVGLLRLQGERMARVLPMYYRAAPVGGPQGPWQLEEIEFCPNFPPA